MDTIVHVLINTRTRAVHILYQLKHAFKSTNDQSGAAPYVPPCNNCHSVISASPPPSYKRSADLISGSPRIIDTVVKKGGGCERETLSVITIGQREERADISIESV